MRRSFPTCGLILLFLATASLCQNADGLYVVELGGKYGYINQHSKIVVPTKFDYADEFTDGLAAAWTGGPNNSKAGFINESGEFQIPPVYEEARPFNGGVAAVKSVDRWGFIDTTGDFIVRPSFEQVHDFNEGLGAFKAAGKWGYMSSAGE